jgi:hypothetical protein
MGAQNRPGGDKVKAVILGCGPAGLLAAHACAQRGVDFDIFSIREKSNILGAQFLHVPIQGICDEPHGHIVLYKQGTKRGYAEKVYGNPDAVCSWDAYQEGTMPAWSLRRCYDMLWEQYKERIKAFQIGSDVLDMLEAENYDFRFSSIPAPALCSNVLDHSFAVKKIWVIEQAPMGLPDNCIMYNGDPKVEWYRASVLWGHAASEYGHYLHGAHEGIKPLETTCNCRPEWQRIGRFGQWKKGVLVHDAYGDVLGALHAV